MIGRTLSHYRIERLLGEGGMGAVYAAHDTRLERPVALKLIRAGLADERLRRRFWREARAAAALDHPGICQIHELGEEEDELYIVMELLEGETLAERLTRGALFPEETIRLGLDVLDPLGALHARGLVHRDLKPSNVFLLSDGRVKLLDFGLVLARPAAASQRSAHDDLTLPGAIVGTPRYMAPEQIMGEEVDARTDLFALASLLYESLAGGPAYDGASAFELLGRVLQGPPPPLSGSADRMRLGDVLRRSLARRKEDRHSDAAALAGDLRALSTGSGSGTHEPEQGAPGGPPAVGGLSFLRIGSTAVRLAVLPFRLLRPDSELDFLGPSLADAVAMSLTGIQALIVRSPLAAARFASGAVDFGEMGRALKVDVILVGTILPGEGRCRVAAQLVQAPEGQVLWSQTQDVSSRDVFELQDQLTRRIVESLQLPLSAREASGLGRDVPANPSVYELFLRANRSALVGQDLIVARDLYLKAIEVDPQFAPAWAQLGRCYRIMGKYQVEGRAENYRRAGEALARALELRPELPAAHYALGELDLDRGRPEAAVDRMLALVERNPNDPQGYAGLVTGLRYLGLLEDSRAAHRRARSLDPEIPTSVLYTLDSLGELELSLVEGTFAGVDGRSWVLARLGHREEAIAEMRRAEARLRPGLDGTWIVACRAALEGKRDETLATLQALHDFPDPEGLALCGMLCAQVSAQDDALSFLEPGVRGGYANLKFLEEHPWLEPVRRDARYAALVEVARARRDAAAERYREGLGVLGR